MQASQDQQSTAPAAQDQQAATPLAQTAQQPRAARTIDAEPTSTDVSEAPQTGGVTPPPPESMPPFEPVTLTDQTYSTMLDAHFSGVLLYDAQGRTLYASPHSERLTGWSAEERYGRPGWELVHPDDFEEAARLWTYLVSEPGREVSFEQRVLTKDGGQVWVEAKLRNLLGVHPVNAIVASYHDITERKRAYAALRDSERRQRELAHRDTLTGVHNRRALGAALQRACHQVQVGDIADFAVLFIDLDGFKKVNDRLGHAFGDAYLRQTAQRLRDVVGRQDLVARIGGDEFAVLATTIETRAQAESLAHRLVHALSDPVRIQGHLVQLPACVGVANAGGRTWTPEDHLRHADAALYAAKQEGTGRVRIFDATLERRLRETEHLGAELALALDRQQLDVLYQPIVELRTRRVVGLEALVCWRHPERGLLRAGQFIQAAEDSGLVIQLGEQVFDRVCRHAARWRDRFGDDAPWLTANLSPAQLIRQDFPQMVERILATHDPAPGSVRFELTERGLFETEGPWRERLLQAQQAGVPLVIDDFGAGYTSLRYLAEFPVSALKVDQAYVRQLEDERPEHRQRAVDLLAALSRMGGSLGIEVVAEGIEQPSQHAAAVEAGCTLGQGWLYARAMEARDVEEALARGGWTL